MRFPKRLMVAALCATAIPSRAWALDTTAIYQVVISRGVSPTPVGAVTFTPLGPAALPNRCQYLMEWTRGTEQGQSIIDEVQTRGETDCFASMPLNTVVMKDPGSPCFAWDLSAQAFREVLTLVARESGADGSLRGVLRFAGPGPSLFHFVATIGP